MLMLGNMLSAAMRCVGKIMENFMKRYKSEAELRFAVGGPILRMICSLWNLKVCVCLHMCQHL